MAAAMSASWFLLARSVSVQRALRQLRVVCSCVRQRLFNFGGKGSRGQLFVAVLLRGLRALLVVRYLCLYLLRIQPLKFADCLVCVSQLLLKPRRLCGGRLQLGLRRILRGNLRLQLLSSSSV